MEDLPAPPPLTPTPAPEKRGGLNMPLVLTVACPGLGHLLYGAPIRGLLYIFITLSTLLAAMLFGFQAVMAVVMAASPMRPLFMLGLVLVYGLFFTARVMYDASRLGAPKPAESAPPTPVGRVMTLFIFGELAVVAILAFIIIQLLLS